MEYEDFLLIPTNQIGTLIGNKGKTKRTIEKKTGAELKINSKTGKVTIIRDENTNPVKAIKAKQIVEAIGKKFKPKHALELAKKDIYLRTINLKDLLGSAKKTKRQKARIIGRKGKAKEKIEKYTNTYITADKKTVNVIGDIKGTEIATKAIKKLAQGSKHSNVYRFIKQKMI